MSKWVSWCVAFMIVTLAWFPALGESDDILPSSLGSTYWGVFVSIADYNGTDADIPVERSECRRRESS